MCLSLIPPQILWKNSNIPLNRVEHSDNLVSFSFSFFLDACLWSLCLWLQPWLSSLFYSCLRPTICLGIPFISVLWGISYCLDPILSYFGLMSSFGWVTVSVVSFKAFFLVEVQQTYSKVLLFLFSCSVMSDSLQPHGLQHFPGGFLVLHHPPEFGQTHVCWVNDAIQSSHPLSPPSPSALSLSQHQDLFQWVSSLHQVAKVLELQHQFFQWVFRVDFL